MDSKKYLETMFVLLLPALAVVGCNDADFSGNGTLAKDTKSNSSANTEKDPEPLAKNTEEFDQKPQPTESSETSDTKNETDTDSGTNVEDDKPDLDIETLTDTESVRKACDITANETHTEEIYFQPTSECPFGVGDNLSKRNEYIRARTEQTHKVSLGEKAVICNLQLDFPPAPIEYDDQLYIVFDRFILAGSKLVNSMYKMEDGLKIYDWKQMQNNKHPGFAPECMGGRCNMPEAEDGGTFEIEIPQQAVNQMALKTKGQTAFDFRLITVGDDNGGDCRHTGLKMKVTVSYIK